MKIKYSVANGSCIFEMNASNASMEYAERLLESENVIKLTIVKKTPAQYFKELNKRARSDD